MLRAVEDLAAWCDEEASANERCAASAWEDDEGAWAVKCEEDAARFREIASVLREARTPEEAAK